MLVVEELFLIKTPGLFSGRGRGVILLAAVQGLPVAEYTPLQVKMAVVGYEAEKKRSGDGADFASLKSHPQTGRRDALAIAICYAHSWRLPGC